MALRFRSRPSNTRADSLACSSWASTRHGRKRWSRGSAGIARSPPVEPKWALRLPQGTPAHNSSGASAATTPEDDADASFDDRLNLRSLFRSAIRPRSAMANGSRSSSASIPRSSAAYTRAMEWTRCRLARCRRCSGPRRSAIGWTRSSRQIPGRLRSSRTRSSNRPGRSSPAYVSGRGPLPAIRIAAQPYGILPVTAFSRIQWFPATGGCAISFLASLYNLLRQLDADWANMSQNVAWVGKAGDPHQTLLDISASIPLRSSTIRETPKASRSSSTCSTALLSGPHGSTGHEPEPAGAADCAA